VSVTGAWHCKEGTSDAQIPVPGLLHRRRAQGTGDRGRHTAGGCGEEAVRQPGGTLECFYFAFGTEDLIVICDLPDNQSAAAFSLAINNTGKARGRVTPLMTPEEMDQATKQSPEYRAPGEP
jgi:hypothetical protein